MFKTLFCKLYYAWIAKAVQPESPLVRGMDMLITSQCKYCMALRAVLSTVGIMLMYPHWIIGSCLILLTLALTWGERMWLCELPPPGEPK